MNNKITFSWLVYHLRTFLELIFVFHPFKRIGNNLPMVCIPNGSIGTFLFAVVTSLIIDLPLILFIANIINAGVLIPELFIVSIFGIVFGTIFRNIQARMVSHVHIDEHKLALTYFGFYKKEVTIFERDELKNMVLIKEKYRNTKNYKVCIELVDGRQLMLELTIFKQRAERILNTYRKALHLLVSDPSKKQIINDAHITISN